MSYRVAYRFADGSIEPVGAGLWTLDQARRTASTFLAPSTYTGRPATVEVYAGEGRKGPNGFEWTDHPDGPTLVGQVTATGIDWAAGPSVDDGQAGAPEVDASAPAPLPLDGLPLTIFDALETGAAA